MGVVVLAGGLLIKADLPYITKGGLLPCSAFLGGGPLFGEHFPSLRFLRSESQQIAREGTAFDNYFKDLTVAFVSTPRPAAGPGLGV